MERRRAFCEMNMRKTEMKCTYKYRDEEAPDDPPLLVLLLELLSLTGEGSVVVDVVDTVDIVAV